MTGPYASSSSSSFSCTSTCTPLLLVLLLLPTCKSKPAAPLPDPSVSLRPGAPAATAPDLRVRVTLDPSKGPPVTVTAEVAATASARARGLMFRDHLPAGEGMFFPYPYADRHHFYMKNTRIPLDIIFFNAPAGEAVVVGVLEDMRPFDETPRSVDAPSTAALEVNARFARSHHIEPGTRVLIEPVSPPSK